MTLCPLSLRERVGVRGAASANFGPAKAGLPKAGGGPYGFPHPDPLPEGEGGVAP